MEYKPIALNARLMLGGRAYYRNDIVSLPEGDYGDYVAMGFGRQPSPMELVGKIHRPFPGDKQQPRVEQGPKADFEPVTEHTIEEIKPQDSKPSKQQRREIKNAFRRTVVIKSE